MTARTPYALLYECIHRLSKGLAVDELVADEGVVDQIRALGLLERIGVSSRWRNRRTRSTLMMCKAKEDTWPL